MLFNADIMLSDGALQSRACNPVGFSDTDCRSESEKTWGAAIQRGAVSGSEITWGLPHVLSDPDVQSGSEKTWGGLWGGPILAQNGSTPKSTPRFFRLGLAIRVGKNVG